MSILATPARSRHFFDEGDLVTTRPTRPSCCSVCRSPHRAQVEALVVGGASQRSVAKRFGNLDKDAMSRHFRNHVTKQRRAELMAGPARVTELANAAAHESKSLLEQLQIVRSVLLNRFLAAAEGGDNNGVAIIAGRLLDALDRLGRVSGELRQLSGVVVNQINVFTDPRFLALQRGLVEIARQHPAARGAIVDLLRGLDVETAGPTLPMIECEAVDAA